MAHALGQISIDEIADSQCGVVALRDVLTAGVTPAQVRWRLTSGRWQRPMRDVLLLAPDPPSPTQLLWCAVESVGPDAYLAGPTAASLDGLRGHGSAAITVVVASGRRIAPRPGLVVRRTARLDPVDIVRDGLPRRTRLARSIVDSAEWAPGRDEARAVLAAAVQQRLVTVDQLRLALGRRGPITRRTLVADTVDELEAAADAMVDVLYARMEAQFGLPAGSRRTTTAFGGSSRRLDVSYDRWHVRVHVDNGPNSGNPNLDNPRFGNPGLDNPRHGNPGLDNPGLSRGIGLEVAAGTVTRGRAGDATGNGARETIGDGAGGPTPGVTARLDHLPDVAGRQVVLRFPTRTLREAPEVVAAQVRAALRDHGRPD